MSRKVSHRKLYCYECGRNVAEVSKNIRECIIFSFNVVCVDCWDEMSAKADKKTIDKERTDER